jgi:hypothetical protein
MGYFVVLQTSNQSVERPSKDAGFPKKPFIFVLTQARNEKHPGIQIIAVDQDAALPTPSAVWATNGKTKLYFPTLYSADAFPGMSLFLYS